MDVLTAAVAAGGGGGGPAPFLSKTYEMVDDSQTDEIVSWTPTGHSFVVWNPPQFARILLPTYFKHNNFSSFIRLLNTCMSFQCFNVFPDMSAKTSMCFFHKSIILLETSLWSRKSYVLVAPIVCTRRCWHRSLHLTRMKSLHVTSYQSLTDDLIRDFIPDIH